MPMIVAEFIEPQTREMEQLVGRLLPAIGREAVTQIVFSIIGQVLFYRFTMPMMLLLRRVALPAGLRPQNGASHHALLAPRDRRHRRGEKTAGRRTRAR